VTERREGLVSVAEAAQRLACSTAALRRWIAQGRLRPVRLGRAVRLRVAEVDRAISEGIPPLPQR
jgi:excisionase family DNA binding protein